MAAEDWWGKTERLVVYQCESKREANKMMCLSIHTSRNDAENMDKARRKIEVKRKSPV